MSDKKISELDLAGALNLDDLLALVQDGETKRVTLRQLINELQLNIPQPRIKIRRDTDKGNFGHDSVSAYWEGSDARFMKYNPEYWCTGTKGQTGNPLSTRRLATVKPFGGSAASLILLTCMETSMGMEDPGQNCLTVSRGSGSTGFRD